MDTIIVIDEFLQEGLVLLKHLVAHVWDVVEESLILHLRKKKKLKVWSAPVTTQWNIHITRLISYHEVVLQRWPGVHERDSCHCWQWSHGNGLSFKRREAELNCTHLKEKQSRLSFDSFYPHCVTTWFIFRTVSHVKRCPVCMDAQETL